MRILKIQTLRGPNYWSIRRHKLIVMRLDLEELADKPSNEIPGFYEGLVAALPSLEEHFCSPGCRGGFFSLPPAKSPLPRRKRARNEDEFCPDLYGFRLNPADFWIQSD